MIPALHMKVSSRITLYKCYLCNFSGLGALEIFNDAFSPLCTLTADVYVSWIMLGEL